MSPAVEAIQRLHSRCCVWDPVFRNAWWLLQRFFWQQYGGFHKWGIPKIVGLFHISIYFMDDLEVPPIWGNLTKIIILLYPECRCGMFGWFGATVELFFVWETPDFQRIRCGGIGALLPSFRIQKVFCCCLELMSESCSVGPSHATPGSPDGRWEMTTTWANQGRGFSGEDFSKCELIGQFHDISPICSPNPYMKSLFWIFWITVARGTVWSRWSRTLRILWRLCAASGIELVKRGYLKQGWLVVWNMTFMTFHILGIS